MPYSKQTWVNGDSTKPLSDTRLGYMEAGIQTAQAAAEAAQAEIDRTTLVVFNVRDPAFAGGAKGDGTTNDTAAIAAARLAMVTAGAGILYFPAGTYNTTGLPNLSPPTAGPLPYALLGDGSSSTIIKVVGTSVSASLTVNSPAFDTSVGNTGAPEWSGFTIDGTGSTGGCSGLIWGDISYPMFRDIVVKNFTTGDGLCFYNGYGWTEGVQMVNVRSEGNLNQIRFDVGSGRQLATVATTIASGATAQTTIAVSALTEALFSGQQIVLAAGPSVGVTPAGTGGVATQTVTVSAAVAVGATSIPVTSFTASAAYTSGTAAVHFGGYGSYDYWTVHSLYLKPAANQHGWVSEVSRGLGQNLQRVGAKIRVTGNSRNGTGNTGILMWLKGNDTYPDTEWDWMTETGGSGANHKSLQFDTSAGVLGGGGIFSMYGAETATFAGGTYQVTFKGQILNVKGVSDLTSSTTFRRFTVPGGLNIASGVKPSAYPTTITSGTTFRNTTGYDVFVTLPITFTGAGTATWNEDNFSGGLPSGPSMKTGAAGEVFPLTFIHHHLAYVKVDVTNATIGTPVPRYCT